MKNCHFIAKNLSFLENRLIFKGGERPSEAPKMSEAPKPTISFAAFQGKFEGAMQIAETVANGQEPDTEKPPKLDAQQKETLKMNGKKAVEELKAIGKEVDNIEATIASDEILQKIADEYAPKIDRVMEKYFGTGRESLNIKIEDALAEEDKKTPPPTIGTPEWLLEEMASRETQEKLKDRKTVLKDTFSETIASIDSKIGNKPAAGTEDIVQNAKTEAQKLLTEGNEETDLAKVNEAIQKLGSLAKEFPAKVDAKLAEQRTEAENAKNKEIFTNILKNTLNPEITTSNLLKALTSPEMRQGTYDITVTVDGVTVNINNEGDLNGSRIANLTKLASKKYPKLEGPVEQIDPKAIIAISDKPGSKGGVEMRPVTLGESLNGQMADLGDAGKMIQPKGPAPTSPFNN